MGGRERLAQCRHHVFKSEFLHHGGENTLVAFGIGISGLHIAVGFETEAKLGIFLIAYANIDILHQRTHNRLCFFLSPQFFAEIKVDTHSHAVALGSLAGQAGKLGGLVAYGRSDTAPVEPVGTFHNGVEIEIRGVCLGDGRTGTVVDNLRRAHRSACFAIVYTYAIASARHIARVNAVTTQGIDRGLAYLVFRQLAHKAGFMAIIGATDCHIGLAATPYNIKIIYLHKALASGRRKAKHYFTQCYYLHCCNILQQAPQHPPFHIPNS